MSDLIKVETLIHLVIEEEIMKNDNLSFLGVFKKIGARKTQPPEKAKKQTSFSSNFLLKPQLSPCSLKASILVLMELGIEKDDVVAELVSQ